MTNTEKKEVNDSAELQLHPLVCCGRIRWAVEIHAAFTSDPAGSCRCRRHVPPPCGGTSPHQRGPTVVSSSLQVRIPRVRWTHSREASPERRFSGLYSFRKPIGLRDPPGPVR